MSKEKRFCIIAVDYEGHVPRDHDDRFIDSTSIFRGLRSLGDQTLKDFNLIICHDGPKQKTYEDEGIDFNEFGLEPYIINTETRMSDWGHSSRDLAMKYAYENNLGEYYVQFNIDNELFPQALQVLSDAMDSSENQIFIFPVHHWKASGGDIFTGVPPRLCNIDCMQLVAHKNVWKSVGMWYNKDGMSDGTIYQDMCERFPWTEVQECLGHNF